LLVVSGQLSVEAVVSAVLLTSDLSVSSAAAGAAARAGVSLKAAFDVASLLSHVQAGPTSLVVIDLGTPGLDPARLLPELRQIAGVGRRVLAFGPHVHELKLAAAREAGCDEVLTRGQFHANLDRILGQFRPEASPLAD
jgi:DNA-binding response OmpR family regulator